MSEPDYQPSPTEWVRNQVATIEATGDTRSVDIQGLSVVLLTMQGARSGAIRKVPLMRVEHDGVYAAVASRGGAPTHPQWYHNLIAHPEITLQDGTRVLDVTARLATPTERSVWWDRCVAAFPPYAEYVVNAEAAGREIPVFLLEPR